MLQVRPTTAEIARAVASSQLALAKKAYREGRGATPNLTKSLGLYTLAAECGVEDIAMKASHELGMAYAFGIDVIPKSLVDAKKWLTRAKQQGSPTAGEKLSEVLAEIEANHEETKTAMKASGEAVEKRAEEFSATIAETASDTSVSTTSIDEWQRQAEAGVPAAQVRFTHRLLQRLKCFSSISYT